MSYDWDKYYKEKAEIWTTPDAVFVKELESLSPGVAVDLGAGEGADSIWMAKQGWKVTAVDSSKAALKNLLSVAKKSKLKVNATCSDILKFISQDPFDLVYLGFIHFPSADRPALFKKCANLMKYSGKLLIVSIINPENPTDQSLPKDVFPTKTQLVGELESLGFNVEKAESIYRKMEWSDDEGFEGETLLALASKSM